MRRVKPSTMALINVYKEFKEVSAGIALIKEGQAVTVIRLFHAGRMGDNKSPRVAQNSG